ncbi:hypothetical protein Cs7R123_27520 [Catellatospora sp. TT07R-123]|uniref:DUF4240 domain-containing protein n=1 Tax=Catellatospora sp. TT07R-123 TaxID=2733863 RepID=UPI001B0C808D|nr:DUF4240 domain-containing protein [Catellatospora sp. TT07R-123]GHJ45410.1 hypothetical protein Cs7R123_27520 [Catellatospora sp. TT07R-123]
MDTDRFWALIEQARTDVEGEPGEDGAALAKALTARLVELPGAQIEQFAAEFERLRGAADRYDLWGAAHLIGSGCTRDGFLDFRSGLVAAGRHWYEAALADPDALAGHPAVAEAIEWNDDSAIFAELVGYAPANAYRQVTGAELPAVGETEPAAETEPAGERWDFDDDAQMRHRLPRLASLTIGWPPNEGCRC